jgi:hypothetical protein
MAFPAGWPPRLSTNGRPIRFYVKASGTAAFADAAYLFSDGVGANTFTPTPVIAPGDCKTVVNFPATPFGTGVGSPESGQPEAMIWANTIRVCNDESVGGAELEFSFDGVNVHGRIAAGSSVIYRHRAEAGIAVRAAAPDLAVAFHVEAW